MDREIRRGAARLGLDYNAPGPRTLSRIVGEPAAKEIFFTARRFEALEANSIGLVNRVLPKGGLDDFVAHTAEMIAENAPLTLRAARQRLPTTPGRSPSASPMTCATPFAPARKATTTQKA